MNRTFFSHYVFSISFFLYYKMRKWISCMMKKTKFPLNITQIESKIIMIQEAKMRWCEILTILWWLSRSKCSGSWKWCANNESLAVRLRLPYTQWSIIMGNHYDRILQKYDILVSEVSIRLLCVFVYRFVILVVIIFIIIDRKSDNECLVSSILGQMRACNDWIWLSNKLEENEFSKGCLKNRAISSVNLLHKSNFILLRNIV